MNYLGIILAGVATVSAWSSEDKAHPNIPPFICEWGKGISPKSRDCVQRICYLATQLSHHTKTETPLPSTWNPHADCEAKIEKLENQNKEYARIIANLRTRNEQLCNQLHRKEQTLVSQEHRTADQYQALLDHYTLLKQKQKQNTAKLKRIPYLEKQIIVLEKANKRGAYQAFTLQQTIVEQKELLEKLQKEIEEKKESICNLCEKILAVVNEHVQKNQEITCEIG